MKDVIVVGGGLLGMLAARALYQAGLDVLLIEQHELGRSTSWQGNGLLLPHHFWDLPLKTQQLVTDSIAAYPALCAELEQDSHVNIELLRSGLLVLGTALAPYLDHLNAQQLLHDQIAQHVPDLNIANATQAAYLPHIYQLRNTHFLTALRASLRFKPVIISEHHPVTSLLINDNVVHGVSLAGQELHARQVILAANNWNTNFAHLCDLAGVGTLTSHSLLFRAYKPLLSTMVIDGQYSLVGRSDGRLLFSTLATSQPNELNVDAMLETAWALLPSLREVEMRNHWSSTFSVMQNREPVVGVHPTLANLWLNTGHADHMWCSGIASVQQLVKQVLGNHALVR